MWFLQTLIASTLHVWLMFTEAPSKSMTRALALAPPGLTESAWTMWRRLPSARIVRTLRSNSKSAS